MPEEEAAPLSKEDLEAALKSIMAEPEPPKQETATAVVAPVKSQTGVGFALLNSDVSDKSKFIERSVYDIARKLYKETKEHLLAQGPTGSGKTRMWHEIGKENNQEVTRICVDDTVSLRELQGELSLIKDGEATITKWNNGILSNALKKPGMVIFDEMSRMSGNKISPLNQILDSGKMYVKGYGWVEKHPECRIVATLNPHTGIYSGTHKLDASIINRFLCIEVPQFTPDELAQIVPDSDLKAKLIEFYLKVHEAMQQEELDFEFSIRNISYICQALALGVSLKQSLFAGFLNSIELVADSDQKNLVLNIATATFGTGILR